MYPYLKRLTWLCHPFLGAVDGLAPVGGWVAVTDHVTGTPFLLGGRGRALDRRIRHHLRDHGPGRRPRPGPALDPPPVRDGEALRVTRAATWRRSCCWCGWGSRSASARSTTSASRWWPRCSPTRTRSSRERSLARGHGVPDHERRDRAGVPGRGAGRCSHVTRRRGRRCHGLVRRFGERTALAGVDLDVAAGESLLSPGRTVPARRRSFGCSRPCCAPARAAVAVCGHALPRRPRAPAAGRLRGHDPLAYPGLTARENLALYAALYRVRRRADGPALERVGLGSAAGDPSRSSRAGWRSGSRSPARCCTRRRCCCSTSRPARSTSDGRGRCSRGAGRARPHGDRVARTSRTGSTAWQRRRCAWRTGGWGREPARVCRPGAQGPAARAARERGRAGHGRPSCSPRSCSSASAWAAAAPPAARARRRGCSGWRSSSRPCSGCCARSPRSASTASGTVCWPRPSTGRLLAGAGVLDLPVPAGGAGGGAAGVLALLPAGRTGAGLRRAGGGRLSWPTSASPRWARWSLGWPRPGGRARCSCRSSFCPSRSRLCWVP